MPLESRLLAPAGRLVVHCVRHGEVSLPEGERVYGDLEIPLSARGLEQLEQVGEDLADAPLVCVACSDLTRAQTGAAAIAARHPGVPIRVDRNLREIYRGDWRNLTWSEIDRRWPGGARRFVEEPGTYADHKGETLTDVRRRAASAWRDLLRFVEVARGKAPAGDPTPEVAIVSHSWILRCLLAELFRAPLTAAMSFPLETGSIQTIEWTGSRWRFLRFNVRPQPPGRTHLRTQVPAAPAG